MGTPVSYIVNCFFGWFIVLLAIAGYFLTLRRLGEKWAFWNVLAIGWALFAGRAMTSNVPSSPVRA